MQAPPLSEEEKAMPAFLQNVRQRPLFKNPRGLEIMCDAYNITSHSSLLSQPSIDRNDLYKTLRYNQNQLWARESVRRGIEQAKARLYDNALKCYKHALEIEPRFKDAFVARGAAYVHMDLLEDGVAEFRTALELDPSDQNARLYLNAALERIQQRDSSTQQGSDEKNDD
eukprot:TRINITY_DN67198_c12_g3_i2.p3 TRINITY_DN67198_c12_g3~~TRINITY_DN67198_c12_g3_i2.p3  ORF type:complete len:170 (-),score=102.78 TRINITY_DN67198_c12_g3_i2:83-592(-)